MGCGKSKVQLPVPAEVGHTQDKDLPGEKPDNEHANEAGDQQIEQLIQALNL